MADYTNDGRLKPCPLCDGHAHITEVVRSLAPSAYFAACDDQDCRLFEVPGKAHYHETVDGAVDAWNAMRRCPDCTERRGYYLDAETIRNQQERIRSLEIQLAAIVEFANVVQVDCDKRDKLIRDMLRTRCPSHMRCSDCEHEKDEGCEFMTRAIELGVDAW